MLSVDALIVATDVSDSAITPQPNQYELPSSSRTRVASAVVVPGRRPMSISVGLHQPRNVSGLTPTRGPIRSTAAFNDNFASWSRASSTSRTARSRNSFGYFLGAGIAPTLPCDRRLHKKRGGSLSVDTHNWDRAQLT